MGVPQRPLQQQHRPTWLRAGGNDDGKVDNLQLHLEAPPTPGHYLPTGGAAANPEPALLLPNSDLPCKLLGAGPTPHQPPDLHRLARGYSPSQPGQEMRVGTRDKPWWAPF